MKALIVGATGLLGKALMREWAEDEVVGLGSKDVDIAKASEAFGVQAEQVHDPAQIKAALARAKRANVAGQPYLLEMLVQRDGVGAGSTWYPPFSVAAMRTRNV